MTSKVKYNDTDMEKSQCMQKWHGGIFGAIFLEMHINLAKLGDGLNKSPTPTVMLGDKKK